MAAQVYVSFSGCIVLGLQLNGLGFGDHSYFLVYGFQISIYLCMCIWVVVKIMVPFWVPIIIRPLIFRVPKKGP